MTLILSIVGVIVVLAIVAFAAPNSFIGRIFRVGQAQANKAATNLEGADPTAMYDLAIKNQEARVTDATTSLATIQAEIAARQRELDGITNTEGTLGKMVKFHLGKVKEIDAALAAPGAKTEELNKARANHVEQGTQSLTQQKAVTAQRQTLEAAINGAKAKLAQKLEVLRDAQGKVDSAKSEARLKGAELKMAQFETKMSGALAGIGAGDTSNLDTARENLLRKIDEETSRVQIARDISGEDAKADAARFVKQSARDEAKNEFEALLTPATAV